MAATVQFIGGATASNDNRATGATSTDRSFNQAPATENVNQKVPNL